MWRAVGNAICNTFGKSRKRELAGQGSKCSRRGGGREIAAMPSWVFFRDGGDGIERSKYNVGRDADKRTCDGIVFDSVMEMRYYRDELLPRVGSGEIRRVELQKPYELQPKFVHDGKTVRAITYVADFYVEFADGTVEVVDVKGMADSLARCKRKLFWYNYPDITYIWVTYVKKYGGWRDWDEVNALRKLEKRQKRSKGGRTEYGDKEDHV